MSIDPAFLSMPLERLADAGLDRARRLGASHAELRLERVRRQVLSARDTSLQSAATTESTGMSVRVLHDGIWGFAAGVDLREDAAATLAARAVDVARTIAPLCHAPVLLAAEPAYVDTYVSPCRVDPFSVSDEEKIDTVVGLTSRGRRRAADEHVSARLQLISEQKFFGSLHGSRIRQQRTRVAGDVTVSRLDRSSGRFETMSTTLPPAARGWEYFADDSLGRDAESLPLLLEEKLASPAITPGRYDLVIDPTNLWLALHESVAHATELDRALGHEANYAGTSYATPDQLDRLRIGNPLMQVSADRTQPGGLATVAYDDEGVAAQEWDLVRDGVLVGFQSDRQTAAQQGFARSTACAYAAGAEHVPLPRIANVSLRPGNRDVTVDDLIGGVDDGLYVVGHRTWSVEMRRRSFQLSCQRCYRIRGGRLAGQVRGVAYTAGTVEFWTALSALGGAATSRLQGLINCGKGEPAQMAPATHACPAAMFRRIAVVNTAAERES